MKLSNILTELQELDYDLKMIDEDKLDDLMYKVKRGMDIEQKWLQNKLTKKFENPIILKAKCSNCGLEIQMIVEQSDYEKYNDGEGLVSSIFDYLSPASRELFISGMCNDCWNKVMGPEE